MGIDRKFGSNIRDLFGSGEASRTCFHPRLERIGTSRSRKNKTLGFSTSMLWWLFDAQAYFSAGINAVKQYLQSKAAPSPAFHNFKMRK